MNIIIENLISHIKSRKPTEWSSHNLEEFYFDICAIYYYTPNKDERQKLRDMFNRIIQQIATNRKSGLHLNPGALDFIDKTSKYIK